MVDGEETPLSSSPPTHYPSLRHRLTQTKWPCSLSTVFPRVADFVNFRRYPSLATIGLSPNLQFVRRNISPAHDRYRGEGRALEDCGKVVMEVGETAAGGDVVRERISQPAG